MFLAAVQSAVNGLMPQSSSWNRISYAEEPERGHPAAERGWGADVPAH